MLPDLSGLHVGTPAGVPTSGNLAYGGARSLVLSDTVLDELLAGESVERICNTVRALCATSKETCNETTWKIALAGITSTVPAAVGSTITYEAYFKQLCGQIARAGNPEYAESTMALVLAAARDNDILLMKAVLRSGVKVLWERGESLHAQFSALSSTNPKAFKEWIRFATDPSLPQQGVPTDAFYEFAPQVVAWMRTVKEIMPPPPNTRNPFTLLTATAETNKERFYRNQRPESKRFTALAWWQAQESPSNSITLLEIEEFLQALLQVHTNPEVQFAFPTYGVNTRGLNLANVESAPVGGIFLTTLAIHLGDWATLEAVLDINLEEHDHMRRQRQGRPVQDYGSGEPGIYLVLLLDKGVGDVYADKRGPETYRRVIGVLLANYDKFVAKFPDATFNSWQDEIIRHQRLQLGM